MLDAVARLGTDLATYRLAAPFLRRQFGRLKLLSHIVRIRTGQIDLVNRDHDGGVRSLCVLNGLLGLRHNAVISSYDNYRDVSQIRATSTHGSKCRMPGGIEERDALAFHLNTVCTNVLCDAAGLPLSNHRITNAIEK